MSREIKFRAWDKVMNEMFYDSELSNGDLLVIHMDGRLELSDDDTYKVGDFELMQFTGLKDKNGKEIYEGDIFVSRGLCTAVVEWEKEGRFLGFTIGGERKIIYINREPKVEIIGNCFENPELMEAKK